jgi:glycosyltransferase involved in cell wall biosynthesis
MAKIYPLICTLNKKNNMNKVSVIIPIYNAERFLPRCLDSLLGQQLDNIEILLVNDGSSDGSAVVCRDYAHDDIRIRVFDQENMGAVAARNRGLDEANSEYVLFVDADDYVSQEYIPSLYNAAVNTGADIVFSQLCRVKFGSIVEKTEYTEETRKKLSEKLLLLKETYYPGACAKIYNKSLIQRNSIRFLAMEGYFGFAEDMLFALHTAYAADAIAFCPEAVYFYCLDNENSLCTSPEKQGRNNADRLIIIEHMLSFVMDKNFTPDESTPVLQAIENHLHWGGAWTLKKFMESLPSNGYPKHIREHFERYATLSKEQKTSGQWLKDFVKEYMRRLPRVYHMLAKAYSYVSSSGSAHS